ncbi:MAG: hypothetical protein GY754_22690, partial [bacterium]|nr:hypothetical protein [bacterium]
SDIVLVKYDPDGERQWSRQTGTVNADIANEVTTDSSGNIYVAGFSVNSSENEDILLAKYYSNTFESETFNFDLSLNLASSLTVTSKETLLLTKDLDASTNKITLQEGCGSYTLKVKKDGYDTFTQEYTMSELQSGTVTVNLAVRKSKIVYTAWLDGNADVYTIDTDGTNIKRLTTEAGRDYYPSWSPDGSKIVFMSNRACDSECDSAFDLYVMDADGENEKRLTSYGRGVFYPSWSPDGSKIAFSYSKGIYIMDADGNNQRLVAYDPNTCQDPSWSPDGSKIAFMLKSDIYTVDVDGNNLTNLTDPIYGSSGSGSHPSWSPDGSKIAFSYSSGNYEIVVMDADGQNFKNLSLNAAFDDYPSWSPDGSKIVFTSNRDGYYSLYFMDADGQNQTHAAAIGLFYPSWSPF